MSLSLLLTLFTSGLGGADEAPNILVIMIDDVGVDRIGAYDEHPDPGRTPSIDALAAEGIRFTNCWSNPVCSPTRATALTGKYSMRTGVGHYVSQHTANHGLDTTVHSTIAHELQGTFLTAAFGKWHLAEIDDPLHPFHPNDSGFDVYSGGLYNLNGTMAEDCDGDLLANDKQDYFQWIKTEQGIQTQCYSAYATTDTTVDALHFILDAGDDPWFLWVAYHASHTPLHRPPDEFHTYDSELDQYDKPKDNPPLFMKAMTEAMDYHIGRLLDAIPADVRARTTILLVGDNGTTKDATTAPFNPNHAKGTVYEGGINVPLIVSSPRIDPSDHDTECHALVNTTDLYATIADLAGFTADPRDSMSITPYLDDPSRESIRDFVYAEIFSPNGFGPYDVYRRAIRGPKYKFIRKWFHDKPIEVEFYDLDADPFEDHNLVEGDQHDLDSEQLAEFHRLQKIMDCDLPDWDPAVHGQWETPFDHYTSGTDFDPPLDDDTDNDDSFNSVHMALIPKGFHQGRILVWDVQYGAEPDEQGVWRQRWSIIAPDLTGPRRFINQTLELADPGADLFCVGHSWTPDGNLFVTGGTAQYPAHGGWIGGKVTTLFVPPDTADLDSAWMRQADDLLYGRWYPSVSILDNHRILVFGGAEDLSAGQDVAKNTYEVYTIDPGGLSVTRDATAYPGPGYPDGEFWPYNNHFLGLYPRTTVLADGRVFLSGYTRHSARLDHDDQPASTAWEHTAEAASRRIGGGTVPLPNLDGLDGEVILAVGGRDVVEEPTYVSEMSHYTEAGVGNADWRTNLPPMNHKRWRGNTVLLPDFRILVIGGDRHAYNLEHVDEDPVYNAEVLELIATGGGSGEIVGSWTSLPPQTGPRTYHSSAVLLPSGKVFLGGGDTREVDYQIYSPSYLHNGTERPVIDSAPAALGYDQTATIDFAAMTAPAQVEKAVLMRPGTVTHHSDLDQRGWSLEIEQQTNTSITIKTPPATNRVPAGYWMLFLVSNEDTPSEAVWIHVQ